MHASSRLIRVDMCSTIIQFINDEMQLNRFPPLLHGSTASTIIANPVTQGSTHVKDQLSALPGPLPHTILLIQIQSTVPDY